MHLTQKACNNPKNNRVILTVVEGSYSRRLKDPSTPLRYGQDDGVWLSSGTLRGFPRMESPLLTELNTEARKELIVNHKPAIKGISVNASSGDL